MIRLVGLFFDDEGAGRGEMAGGAARLWAMGADAALQREGASQQANVTHQCSAVNLLGE